MGLIKAALGSAGGTLADQWKEFFYCDALEQEVLVVKGQKQINGRSSNTKGNDNIISNGSGIAVADGQCMIIVEQGQIVEVCAEPGQFTYDTSTEPSIFEGPLGEGIKETFKTMAKRFQYGGDTAKDQRVYYFNTKEIVDNKYGTPNPVPFRVVDKNIGLDIDISVRCNGIYSYKIEDPILFYKNVCGNVEFEYTKDEIQAQLKSELLTALQPAFAKISAMGVRYSAIPAHTNELSEALNEILSEKWNKLRGLVIVSFGVNSITASKEDEDMIKELQKSAVMRNPNMAGATLVAAQADAMRMAASNESGGGMMPFIGMGMAQNAGGMNAQQLFQMGAQQQQQGMPQQGMPQQGYQPQGGMMAGGYQQPQQGMPQQGMPQQQAPQQPAQPQAEGWQCSCGAVNRGKFCPECGGKKPAGAPLYQCDKCGWQPADPTKPPKFCPECGDVFDENDKK